MQESSQQEEQQQQSDIDQQYGSRLAPLKINPSEPQLEQFMAQIKELNEALREEYDLINEAQDNIEGLEEKIAKQKKQKIDFERIIREKKALLHSKDDEIARLKQKKRLQRKYYEDQLELKFEEVEKEENIKNTDYKHFQKDITRVNKKVMQNIEKLSNVQHLAKSDSDG